MPGARSSLRRRPTCASLDAVETRQLDRRQVPAGAARRSLARRRSSRATPSPGLTATTNRDTPDPRSNATAGPSAATTRSGTSRSAGSAERSRSSARTDSCSPAPSASRPTGKPPTVRIVAALEADLVAVVDARRARQRRLEERRQPDARDVAAQHGPQPRRVVRAEQVELDRDDVRLVGGRELHDPSRERRPVERPDGEPVLVVAPRRHVEVRAAGEPQDRLAERVVHQRVEAVAAEPVGRDPPDLADEVGVRAGSPGSAAELLPERLVVDLRRGRRAASHRCRSAASARRR